MPDLFTPLQIGPYTLPHRVVMAPLTRCRATEPDRVPTALMVEYYRQRAGQFGASLIISEATQISQQGIGYPGSPGIHTAAQVEGWKPITKAVHDKGGRIFCQLWHVGRVSYNIFQPNGGAPVSSSALPTIRPGHLPDGTEAPRPIPRALETDEIPGIINDYRKAAEHALAAGFDGVEFHGANGYLPEQFLRDGINQRTDRYGGPIENRARFHLEGVRALCEVWGASRVGIRLSPSGIAADRRDSNLRATYSYLITELGKLGLAYLHIMEAMDADLEYKRIDPTYEPTPVSYFRPMFQAPLITNAGFTFDKATSYIREGWADAVAFGKLLIANPDLAERFRRFGSAAPLNKPDPTTFYGKGPTGYTDYPALDAAHASAAHT